MIGALGAEGWGGECSSGEARARPQSKMVASSGPDKKAVLQDAFAKLMDGVEQNLVHGLGRGVGGGGAEGVGGGGRLFLGVS